MPNGQFTLEDIDASGDPRPWQNTHDALVAQAKQQYPFITKLNPVIIAGPKRGGEGWPVGEEGAPDYPRPTSIPIDKHGIEVGPGSTPADIAGEVLHVDPFANTTRDRLTQSLSPQQIAYLKQEALDYDSPDMTEENKMRNAVDSAMRGHLVGQWPAEAVVKMNYTSAQTQMLDQLKQYMTTGQMPTVMLKTAPPPRAQ